MQESRYRLVVWSTLMIICLFCGIVFGILSGCSETSKQTKASYERVSDKKYIAKLPKIGELVTTERALQLCEHYGFKHLANRIVDHPDLFKE